MIAWTPRHGETVHFRASNRHELPTGRYVLEAQDDGSPGDAFRDGYWMRGSTSRQIGMTRGYLQQLEREGRITPIAPAELARERQELTLRRLAPLRGRRDGAMLAQHDASALPLFVAVNEPQLF